MFRVRYTTHTAESTAELGITLSSEWLRRVGTPKSSARHPPSSWRRCCYRLVTHTPQRRTCIYSVNAYTGRDENIRQ